MKLIETAVSFSTMSESCNNTGDARVQVQSLSDKDHWRGKWRLLCAADIHVRSWPLISEIEKVEHRLNTVA